MTERLLTAQEVAELLNVPVTWVREATRANTLPHLCLGRYRRYRTSDLEAWLDQQRHGPAVSRPADLRSRPERACD